MGKTRDEIGQRLGKFSENRRFGSEETKVNSLGPPGLSSVAEGDTGSERNIALEHPTLVGVRHASSPGELPNLGVGVDLQWLGELWPANACVGTGEQSPAKLFSPLFGCGVDGKDLEAGSGVDGDIPLLRVNVLEGLWLLAVLDAVLGLVVAPNQQVGVGCGQFGSRRLQIVVLGLEHNLLGPECVGGLVELGVLHSALLDVLVLLGEARVHVGVAIDLDVSFCAGELFEFGVLVVHWKLSLK